MFTDISNQHGKAYLLRTKFGISKVKHVILLVPTEFHEISSITCVEICTIYGISFLKVHVDSVLCQSLSQNAIQLTNGCKTNPCR